MTSSLIRPSYPTGLTSFSSEKVSARSSLCALTRLFAATQQLARAVTSPCFLRFEFGFQGRQICQPRQCDPDSVVVHPRGRMKKLCHELVARCQALIIRELKHEMQALNHELEIAIQCGLPASSDEVASVEALLGQARSAIASMAARSGR